MDHGPCLVGLTSKLDPGIGHKPKTRGQICRWQLNRHDLLDTHGRRGKCCKCERLLRRLLSADLHYLGALSGRTIWVNYVGALLRKSGLDCVVRPVVWAATPLRVTASP